MQLSYWEGPTEVLEEGEELCLENRYKEFCWRCQVLPDSEDAILLSYLQNHPFFSFQETILPLIKARWLLAALRNSGSHSSTELEYWSLD
jgi:hypothetical protein